MLLQLLSRKSDIDIKIEVPGDCRVTFTGRFFIFFENFPDSRNIMTEIFLIL